jgi:predicted PurR-regulated permease PerM
MSDEGLARPGDATEGDAKDGDRTEPLFTRGQLRFARAVLLGVLAAVLVALLAAAVWALAATISTFRALILPVASAGVLALILNPVVLFLTNRLRLPRVVSAGVVVVLIVGLLIVIAWLVVPMALRQAGQAVERLPEFVNWVYFRLLADWPELRDVLTERIEEVDWAAWMPEAEGAMERIGNFATMSVGVGFVPFFLFFFLLIGERLEAVTNELTALFDVETQEEVRYLVDIFVEYIAVFFRGQLLIALIMAVLFSVGFTMIGLASSVVIGLILGVINIVPFLGTLVGVLTVLPLAYFQEGGNVTLVLMALGVFTVVQLIESWVLNPKIMHDRSGLHPMMVVVSLFFWGALLGGILGMLLAVPLSAFVATVWHRIRFRYARKVVSPIYDGNTENEVMPRPGDREG